MRNNEGAILQSSLPRLYKQDVSKYVGCAFLMQLATPRRTGRGGIFMYGTVFHQGTVSIKNITLPVYDMWAFSIHAKFQIPYVQFVSNLNITFKFEEAEYSVPGYVWW
ncbi:MAG TPA: hypothetical protein PLX17_05235 [Chitinophagaceae bacterium]|nr:hypothetical protein [Chitinophagaceae bacterium]